MPVPDPTPGREPQEEPGREFLIPLDDGRGLQDARFDDGAADSACRPGTSGPEGWALTILMFIHVPVVIALLVGTGTPPGHAVGLVLLVLLVSVVALWVVIRLLWEPFRRRFPAVRPTEAARWKRFQMVRLGAMGGFNHCVDVGADRAHVHLRLMSPLGWLSRPMSVPRSAIEWGDEARPASSFGMAKVRILGRRSRLPNWVFDDLDRIRPDV